MEVMRIIDYFNRETGKKPGKVSELGSDLNRCLAHENLVILFRFYNL